MKRCFVESAGCVRRVLRFFRAAEAGAWDARDLDEEHKVCFGMWWLVFFSLKTADSKASMVPVGSSSLCSRFRNAHVHWRTVDCFRLEMRYITGGSRIAMPQLVGGMYNDCPAEYSRQACVPM